MAVDCTMIVLWVWSLLVVSCICHEVYESQTEDERNTTTILYPLPNKNTKNNSNVTKRQNTSKETTKPSDNKVKESATAWKIDAQFVENESNGTESSERGVIEKPVKEFKPSPHLETYFESDFEQYHPILKKPPVGFQFAKDFPRYPNLDGYTRNGWKVAQPITISDGDLYKVPAFKESEGTDQGADVNFKKENQNGLKKKMNPWKGLLRMMTAFIPVGLIISALTPSVVTIQPGSRSPIKNLHRRFDPAEPRVSEECRRKILCELYKDGSSYSKYRAGRGHPKGWCSQVQCEDGAVLSHLLTELLQELAARSREQTARLDQIYL